MTRRTEREVAGRRSTYLETNEKSAIREFLQDVAAAGDMLVYHLEVGALEVLRADHPAGAVEVRKSL